MNHLFILSLFFCISHSTVSVQYANITYPSVRAGFGNQTFDFLAQLVDIQPYSGCDPIPDSAGVFGKVVLAPLGGCYPQVKARNAQSAGAVGILIESYTVVYGDMEYFTNGMSNSDISIPCLEVKSSTYVSLSEYLSSHGNVSARIYPDYNGIEKYFTNGNLETFMVLFVVWNLSTIVIICWKYYYTVRYGKILSKKSAIFVQIFLASFCE
jgi:hypothetical protein